jgi:hypothetical protein
MTSPSPDPELLAARLRVATARHALFTAWASAILSAIGIGAFAFDAIDSTSFWLILVLCSLWRIEAKP